LPAERQGRHRDEPELEHIETRHEGVMRRFVVLIVTAVALISCSPEDEVTGSIHDRCAADLYGSYNPKVMNQCVAVCIKCDRGSMVTCSTSCTLKGAR
jgi:hypothetical protein